MHSSEDKPPVTLERIFQLFWAFAPPLIIESAVRHHIFDAVDTAPKTLQEICAETGTSERATRSIVDVLAGLNLLTKDKSERYGTTPESSTFLVQGKPSFMGKLFYHCSTQLLPSFLQLSEIVRTGEPATKVDQEATGAPFFKEFVENLFPINYPGAATLAQHFLSGRNGRATSVLDLAAGSGVWSIPFAQMSPAVNVTAVDWSPVIPITREITRQHGVADRYTFIEGDLLKAPFGEKHSIALLGHILHSEGEQRSRALLEKTFSALENGGTIAIAEFLVNEQRTEPVGSLIFAVNMVVHTKEGFTYSFEEIRSWLEKIGFKNVRTLQIPAPSPLILADKPTI